MLGTVALAAVGIAWWLFAPAARIAPLTPTAFDSGPTSQVAPAGSTRTSIPVAAAPAGSTNVAVLTAWLRYVRGERITTWNPSERLAALPRTSPR